MVFDQNSNEMLKQSKFDISVELSICCGTTNQTDVDIWMDIDEFQWKCATSFESIKIQSRWKPKLWISSETPKMNIFPWLNFKLNAISIKYVASAHESHQTILISFQLEYEMAQCASTGNLSTNSHVKRQPNAPIDEEDEKNNISVKGERNSILFVLFKFCGSKKVFFFFKMNRLMAVRPLLRTIAQPNRKY